MQRVRLTQINGYTERMIRSIVINRQNAQAIRSIWMRQLPHSYITTHNIVGDKETTRGYTKQPNESTG